MKDNIQKMEDQRLRIPSMIECDECEGTGEIEKEWEAPNGSVADVMCVCHECDGTGQVSEDSVVDDYDDMDAAYDRFKEEI